MLFRSVAYFSRGNTLLVTVEDAPEALQKGLEGLLNDNAIAYTVERQAGQTLVLKVTTSDDPSSFRTRLRKLAGDAGIKLAARSLEGSSMVFTGRGE